ncbi:Diphthamide biosynthesis protein 4 [Exophiala xenobiotica]|nr:Diphthamide biosynthesis protein 4 [Exophiala xenobiotica]KAK5219542.1 Diphthamide biosynthesis protein 4 [Exophiala xenobiotica]KAK5288235.1 Diphthamide biosynthesis protein 4 [Exophiala xenobiotica]KAK5321859.1 Diphthamide biosynthesis protein 4 [Exophiala xenobiotica]KAK5401711.1 Diphthamide biosynthesis protein 4 [Exophiala xenobiotica]
MIDRPPVVDIHSASQNPHHTHYDVLHLPRDADWSRLSAEDIKSAYRRALLIHHPDKAAHSHSHSPSSLKPKPTDPSYPPAYAVDDIVTAYEVLVDPEKRAAYDAALDRRKTLESGHKGTHIGVEVWDLEDLKFDEAQNVWSKACRCGDEQGYILTDADLERESQHGEIYVGCRGCSLFIKVLFAAADG